MQYKHLDLKSDNGNILQRLYSLITTFHWVSLIEIMVLFLVLLHQESRSTTCKHPVNANIHMPTGGNSRYKIITK